MRIIASSDARGNARYECYVPIGCGQTMCNVYGDGRFGTIKHDGTLVGGEAATRSSARVGTELG
jgi:hypothetical protein